MGKGTDTLMDTAMITLRTSDLLLLPKVFRLSRQTVSLMYRNLFWAFIYNTVGIFVAAGVLYPVYDILLESCAGRCCHGSFLCIRGFEQPSSEFQVLTAVFSAVPILQRTHAHVPLEVFSKERSTGEVQRNRQSPEWSCWLISAWLSTSTMTTWAMMSIHFCRSPASRWC